jgi:hypothetical protein
VNAPALALLIALALLAPAAGQVPDPGLGGASVAVTWAFSPGEVAVTQGSFLNMQAAAHVAVAGLACPPPAGGVVRIDLLLEPAEEGAGGISTGPDPLSFNVTVPPGVHGAAAQGPYEEDVTVPFQLLVDLTAAPGEYELVGTQAVALPAECAEAPSTEAPGPAEPPRIGVRVVPGNFTPEAHPPHEEHAELGFDFVLQPGQAAEKTFNVTGLLPYHDHLHPELRGAIHIEETGPSDVSVRITSRGFEPPEITIKQGGVVNWTNDDRIAHAVSADELHPQHADEHDAEEDAMGSEGEGAAGNQTAAPPEEPVPAPKKTPGAGVLASLTGLAAAAGLAGSRRRR